MSKQTTKVPVKVVSVMQTKWNDVCCTDRFFRTLLLVVLLVQDRVRLRTTSNDELGTGRESANGIITDGS